MRILFIYRTWYAEPFGIMYLSSYLKKNGHSCFFVDTKFEKNIEKEIQDISPEIIAYSITTGEHKFYLELNRTLKKKFKFFAIFGGPHCTFFPELVYKDGVDAICRGEGELAFLELANNLENGKDIIGIKNLWIKKNGNVYKNELRSLIDDLDTLPFPDRDLITKYSYYKKMHRRFILTGRGCPYNCSYCFNHVYNKLYQGKGKVIRKRSVENVIGELKLLKDKYVPKRFQFVDDTLNLDLEWLLDFCTAYKKEIDMPFTIHMRVNLVNEEMVKAIKNAGCATVVTATESGNEHIRNAILKRGISEEQTINAANLFNKYGLKTFIQNIVGLPDETLDMAFETMSLNIKCKPTYGWMSIFQPYPKTELCQYSKEKGYFDGNFDSIEETLFGKSVMRIKNIKEMERLRDLFSLGVAYPFSIPLIKILIKLPLDPFYKVLWHIYRAYCYFFKFKWLDVSEFFNTK